ncbi:Ig-like domain-containing protein [uncultured Hymenobacter sp.]|uniref:Ig-like domain-containing protein n=1 Tax=uncultured Hymenobacter sp. TaxID=170016 RepID=UPI0035CA68BC
MPTSTWRLSLLLRRAALLLPLLCLSWLAQAQIRYEFPLYGSISYQTGGANNREVRFKVTRGVSVQKSRSRDVLPEVGAIFPYGLLDFGDGTAPAVIPLTITYITEAQLLGEGIITHTYAAAGNFTASITVCCMLPNQENNAGQPLSVRTVVAAGSANDSPIASIASVEPSTTILIKAPQTTATYQVNATDPDGDALTYSLATAADVGESGFTNAPGLSVNPSTGLVTFDRTGVLTHDGLSVFNAVIKVSDGKTSVLVNHILRVEAAPASTEPFFTAPLFGNGVLSITPGQNLSFVVRALDADAGDRVTLTLRAGSVPPTAALTPDLPVSSNPAQSTFSWTPTAAEVGFYQVYFVATDSRGLTRTRYVFIKVDPACDAAATAPVAVADQLSTATGSPLTFTAAQLLANDTDPLGRALQVGRVGTPSRGRLVPNADGSYTYTPDAGFVGQVSLSYQLQLAGPVLASAATGHYYEFVSAPGISWIDARTAAAARTYQGLQGYLATVTSVAEKDALVGRAPGQYWFGASDAAVEGEWRWQSGPEAGQLFWRGAATGTALGYANWIPNQPDDFKNLFRRGGEDYGQLYGQSGLWNDLDERGAGGRLAGYVVEYGGLEACTPVLFATGTATITVGGPAAAAATLNRGGLTAPATTAAPAKAGLEAAPNPSAGQFRLRVRAATQGAAQVEVYDLQGRRVKAVFAGELRAGEVRELAVDAPELAAGVYVVRLQSGRQVQHLRIAIHK